ncbi:phage tail protein I [Paludibacterium paludis]|uniref:Phage tail protein I n=1 Tax=Paludibacterium paludis TaxID=1225769 RepID=A0A918NXW1_9NEIS|nr:phage tail protein I [Paludibacterium paludis]GGY03768.1 phage tail protein I [Paludibacterium paludis]
MTKPLLPSGSTPLELAAAEALADAMTLPVPLRTLTNPDTCPVNLLPYLAWALSVDRWDQDWSESTKRKVIKASWYIHKHKGTIGALRRVVEPLGYLIEVIEWFQQKPAAPRGTFRLRVGVLDTGITDAMYQELERMIDDAKPLTRHLVGLAISLEARGQVTIAAGVYLGDHLTIYPYVPSLVEVTGKTGSGGSIHIIDTLTIAGRQ